MMFKSKFFNFIIGLFFLCEVLLIFSSVSFAAGSESDTYFPFGQDVNGLFSEEFISNLDTQFNFTDNYVFVFYRYYQANVGRHHYYVLYFPKNSEGSFYGEINSNGYQFSLYNIGSVSWYQGSFWKSNNNDNINGLSGNGNWASWFSNLDSPLYNSGVSYISNFRIYTNNTDNKSIVMKYGPDDPNFDVPLQGHSKPFDPLLIPDFGIGIVPPNSVPLPYVPPSHSWGNYISPTYDSNDPSGSVYNIISYSYGWLKDNLNNSFSNLGNIISGSSNNLKDTISYFGSIINGNLNTFVTNFYDNMVALLEPITIPFLSIIAMGTDPEVGVFSIPYLTKTLFFPDPDTLNAMLINKDMLGIVDIASDLTTFTTNFQSQMLMNNVLYGFEIPAFTFAGVVLGPYFVDFTWYLDYKDIGDAIISAFLVFGFFMWLHARLPYWLRSQQGDVSGLTTEVRK